MKTAVQLIAPVAALLLPVSATSADGPVIEIELVEVLSFAELGNPLNTVLLIDLNGADNADVTMNGIGWDLTLTTIGGSWASEAVMYFDDNINPDLIGLYLTPGHATTSPVQGANYTGFFKFADAPIPDKVLPDGVLRIEFFENFVDDNVEPDAVWNGSLFVQIVPAPGALAMLGLGGLVGRRRRHS